MLSKRLSVLVVVAAIVVLCTLAASAPAFAQEELFRRANPHANCVGQMHGTTNALDGLEPGNVGLSHTRLAHRGRNGEFVTLIAQIGEPGSETRSVAAVMISFPEGSAVFAACQGGG